MIDLLTIQVKDKTEKCYIIREGFYRTDIGVNFSMDESFIL